MPGLLDRLDPHVEQYLLRDQGEYIVDEVHKAWPASLWPWVRVFIAIPFIPAAWVYDSTTFWLILLVAGGVAAQGLWRIIEEYRDRFVITNQRVFRVHGNLNIQRATVPLIRILDITVKKPFVGRVLNYGHFVFESAAQVQGLDKINYVKDIDKRDYELQRTMQRAGLRATAAQEDDGT
jgi:membrane protein YdbS with pleckstrin-like domain